MSTPGASPQQTQESISRQTPAVGEALTARDSEIVSRLLANPTASARQLARELGIDRAVVARVKAKPQVKRLLADCLRPAIELLIRARQKAARKLDSLVDSQDERIASRVSLGLLQLDPAMIANDNAPRPDGSGVLTVVIKNRSLLEDGGEEEAVEPQSKKEVKQP